MANTENPTGLTIERVGLGFVCGWKIAARDHAAGQQFRWRTNLAENWTTVTIGTTATSKKITLLADDFYPSKGRYLTRFYFQVRGKRGATEDPRTRETTTYAWSAWREASFSLSVPFTPVITAELDGERDNVSTFSWETRSETSDHHPFVRNAWQTILVRACDETDGSKLKWNSTQLGWGTGTSAASGQVTETENTVWLAKDSYTRWVRVRSTGVAGASPWRYAKHVYATPYAAKNLTAKVESVQGGITTVGMSWGLVADRAHPVDRVTVQYYIGTPLANLACPSGVNWTDAVTLADTTGSDAVKFAIDGTVGLDQCLWVRVVSAHDRRETRTAPLLVRCGRLTDPSGLTVTNIDSTTYRATITATNNSGVPDSFLAVRFKAYEPQWYARGRSDEDGYVCGIIPSGQSSIVVQCMPWADSGKVAFGVTACQGEYTLTSPPGDIKQYVVTANMRSGRIWGGGIVPAAPKNVQATISAEGEVRITWTWSWSTANRAEVSWSKNEYAWESTEAPESYLVESVNQSKLRVPGLETGTTWYFRVRLAKETDGDVVYGPYCETVAVDLGTPPEKPTLVLSEAVTRRGKKVTASWTYVPTDGTPQSFADIREVTVDGDTVTIGTRITRATTEKSKAIATNRAGWTAGTTHHLAVRVTSGSGRVSEWSDPVSLIVAEPPVCRITETSLVGISVTDDDGTSRSVRALRSLPMTVTVTGAGEGGTTTLVIERAEAYQMDRPDESVFHGYEGETIASIKQTGEEQITVTKENLVGMLDDGASYRIIATIQDGFGQSAEAAITFLVKWADQARMPSATAIMIEEQTVAIITPTCAAAYAGSVCDIYRLSADRPELIVSGGAWGQRYVDPYPALGQFGGHRVVYRTANGDYITAGNQPAWVDLGEQDGDILDLREAVIDFDGERVRLPYNLSVSSTWTKDFKETKYLGGSIQGDWNKAVSRTGSVGAVAIASSDGETIRGLRRLAAFAGVCHVRTPEGSSFSADVQVTENRDAGRGGKLASFSLSVTRVDPQGPDALPYEEWIAEEGG